MSRRDAGGSDRHLLGVFPVVIRDDEGAVTVTQLQGRIDQRVADALRREGRSEGPDEDFGSAAIEDEAADHGVIARLDETASADVGQLGVRGGVEVVGFDEADAGAAILAAEDGGVACACCGKGGDDGGFQVLGRRDAGGFDLGLLGFLPVVVAENDFTVRPVQLEGRIGEDAGQSHGAEGWAEAAKEHSFRIGAEDDDSPDEDIVAGLDAEAGWRC